MFNCKQHRIVYLFTRDHFSFFFFLTEMESLLKTIQLVQPLPQAIIWAGPSPHLSGISVPDGRDQGWGQDPYSLGSLTTRPAWNFICEFTKWPVGSGQGEKAWIGDLYSATWAQRLGPTRLSAGPGYSSNRGSSWNVQVNSPTTTHPHARPHGLHRLGLGDLELPPQHDSGLRASAILLRRGQVEGECWGGLAVGWAQEPPEVGVAWGVRASTCRNSQLFVVHHSRSSTK